MFPGNHGSCLELSWPKSVKLHMSNSQGCVTTMLNLFCKEEFPWVHQEENTAEDFKTPGINV